MRTKIIILLMTLCFSSIFGQVKENEILSKDATGRPTFIKFSETSVKSSDTNIKTFLKKQYNLKSNSDFKIKKGSEKIENETKIQKLEQYYNGIKIEFNEIVIVSRNDKVKTINGRGLNIETLNISPKLSESEALNSLLEKINAEKYAWEDKSYEELLKNETQNLNATNFPVGELVIIDNDLFDDKFEPILAYKFNVYALKPLSNSYYYVDASNGKVILEDAIIKHVQGTGYTRYSGQRAIETQQSGSSYRLRDYSRGNGVETYNMNNGTNYSNATDFTDNNNVWTTSEFHNSNKDDAALDAHWGAEMTYDYFYQKHNRNSYDNNGSILKNYVHANLVDMDYANNDNAFWDSTYKRMTYGDGQSLFDALTSVDVIGHEIGHGVCSSTANLVYQNEPGAINEGLSDIWGAMIEYFAEPTKQTYNIGEDIMLGGGSLRSMSNPNSSFNSQPDTYNGTYWYSGSADRGGVHTNSGVLNYWFYLLAEGGSGTNDIGSSFNIGGIGKEKASKIVYRAESVYFTSTTNYSQARLLTIQAAEDLYGEGSIEAATTCQSWFAVGVGDNNCNINLQLSGSKIICSSATATYTLNYTPTSITWSTSSNLQILSSTANSITIKPVFSSVNAKATITVVADGISITKTIWVGRPKVNLDYEYNGNYVTVILSGIGATVQEQGINTTNWNYTSTGGGGLMVDTSPDFFVLAYGPDFNWKVYADIGVSNSCGGILLERVIAPGNCNTIMFDGNTIWLPKPCDNEPSPITYNTSTIPEIKKIEVFNFYGKRVTSVKNTSSLNISQLPSGIYIVKIWLNQGEIITKKISK